MRPLGECNVSLGAKVVEGLGENYRRSVGELGRMSGE